MRKLMASTKNFGEYREALHAANPPCIPFFGTLLLMTIFIDIVRLLIYFRPD